MTSEIKADKWSPASGTAGTIGDSGDTFTVPSGVTLDTSSSTLTLPSTVITGQSAKTSLVDADKFLISDSAASGALKYVQKSNLGASNPTLIERIENDSDVSSLTFTNCFSSTYDVYKVVFYIGTTQANGDLHLRFRKNTSDDFTGTDLNGNMFGEIGTTSPTHFDNGGVASSTYLSLSNNDVYSGASSGLAGEILIAFPYLRSNNRIHISYQGVADGSSGVITYVGGWVYSGSEVATGIQFWSGSGSTRFRKSEINVYGYNK